MCRVLVSAPQASKKPLGQQKQFEIPLNGYSVPFVVALWEAIYIENKRFGLDTLRVPNRSPTPISKSKDFRGQSDDICGARGPQFRPILGVPGVRGGVKTHMV